MTKSSKESGFIGESYICSQLKKNSKSFYLTRGRTRSIDLLIIDDKRSAYTVDVLSTKVQMNNLHEHPGYQQSVGKMGRWISSIEQFWKTHPQNTNRVKGNFADFYILHNVNSKSRNFILTRKEFEAAFHNRISYFLKLKNIADLSENYFGPWEVCEYCFDQKSLNAWNKLP